MSVVQVEVNEGMCDHEYAVITMTLAGWSVISLAIPKEQVPKLISDLQAYVEEG